MPDLECENCGTISEDVVKRFCGCTLCSDCYEYEDHPDHCKGAEGIASDREPDIEEDSHGYF